MGQSQTRNRRNNTNNNARGPALPFESPWHREYANEIERLNRTVHEEEQSLHRQASLSRKWFVSAVGCLRVASVLRLVVIGASVYFYYGCSGDGDNISVSGGGTSTAAASSLETDQGSTSSLKTTTVVTITRIVFALIEVAASRQIAVTAAQWFSNKNNGRRQQNQPPTRREREDNDNHDSEVLSPTTTTADAAEVVLTLSTPTPPLVILHAISMFIAQPLLIIVEPLGLFGKAVGLFQRMVVGGGGDGVASSNGGGGGVLSSLVSSIVSLPLALLSDAFHFVFVDLVGGCIYFVWDLLLFFISLIPYLLQRATQLLLASFRVMVAGGDEKGGSVDQLGGVANFSTNSSNPNPFPLGIEEQQASGSNTRPRGMWFVLTFLYCALTIIMLCAAYGLGGGRMRFGRDGKAGVGVSGSNGGSSSSSSSSSPSAMLAETNGDGGDGGGGNGSGRGGSGSGGSGERCIRGGGGGSGERCIRGGELLSKRDLPSGALRSVLEESYGVPDTSLPPSPPSTNAVNMSPPVVATASSSSSPFSLLPPPGVVLHPQVHSPTINQLAAFNSDRKKRISTAKFDSEKSKNELLLTMLPPLLSLPRSPKSSSPLTTSLTPLQNFEATVYVTFGLLDPYATIDYYCLMLWWIARKGVVAERSAARGGAFSNFFVTFLASPLRLGLVFILSIFVNLGSGGGANRVTAAGAGGGNSRPSSSSSSLHLLLLNAAKASSLGFFWWSFFVRQFLLEHCLGLSFSDRMLLGSDDDEEGDNNRGGGGNKNGNNGSFSSSSSSAAAQQQRQMLLAAAAEASPLLQKLGGANTAFASATAPASAAASTTASAAASSTAAAAASSTASAAATTTTSAAASPSSDAVAFLIRAEEGEASCVACFANRPNVLFIPCGHVCCCAVCVRRLATQRRDKLIQMANEIVVSTNNDADAEGARQQIFDATTAKEQCPICSATIRDVFYPAFL